MASAALIFIAAILMINCLIIKIGNHNLEKRCTETTTGRITSVNESNKTGELLCTLEYSVNGRNYKTSFNSVDTSYVNDEVEVYYNPDKPEETVFKKRTDSTNTMFALILAVVLIIASTVIWVINSISNKKVLKKDKALEDK